MINASHAGFPMADNPDQAAVDAELAKFNATWQSRFPRNMVEDPNNPEAGLKPAMLPSFPASEGVTASNARYIETRRLYMRQYQAEKREFIRTNPIIQAALARELAGKVQAVRQKHVDQVAAIVLAGKHMFAAYPTPRERL